MNEELGLVVDLTKEAMLDSLQHLEQSLTKIRAGKATPSLLDSVRVDYYGSIVPLSQVANINSLDARTLTVQPWEKAMIDPISKGIINSNLGLAPQNNGEQIILSIPPLTEERRRNLVKNAKAEGEHAKVGIRTARKEANDSIKKYKKRVFLKIYVKNAKKTFKKSPMNT
jgi:ribosome recycling factor